MTVRAWFRLQRGAIWARGDRFASDLERVTAAVVAGSDPCLGLRPVFSDGLPTSDYYMGETLVVRNVTRYQVVQMLRDDMERALDEMRRIVFEHPVTYADLGAALNPPRRFGTPPKDIAE